MNTNLDYQEVSGDFQKGDTQSVNKTFRFKVLKRKCKKTTNMLINSLQTHASERKVTELVFFFPIEKSDVSKIRNLSAK